MNSDLTITRQISKLMPVRDNSVGHWRFRGVLTDESAQSNDLTAIAIGSYISGGLTENVITAILPTGPAGPAAQILAAAATDFDFGTGDFTIEVIAYTTSSSGIFLVEKHDGGSPLTGFFLGLGSGLIACKIGDGTNEVQGTTAAMVHDNRWHHVAVVVDRANDNMHFYIDGVEDSGSPDDISSVTGSISAASEDLNIGNLFPGGIDEIAITPQVLLAPEIAARAAGLLSPFVNVIPNELKGYFRKIDDNDTFDVFLIPHESPFAAIRKKSQEITDLVKFDQVQERHLPALASVFNFELPDASLLTLTERREMFKWIIWLYQRKGTYLCVDKLIDLAGLTATTVNRFPTTIPFTLNVHRLFGFGRAEIILFTEDFSGNMSQWDPPLNSSLPWRLQNGALYNKVDFQVFANYGILFDDSERSFYIEVDIKMISAIGTNFGFYLAYSDANNWIRIAKETAGGTFIVLRWSDGGTPGIVLLSANIATFWSQYSDGDTIKLWVHADLDTKTYTAGIDETTLIVSVVASHPDIVGGKKGLWQGFNAEVEWDNVTVKDIRTELAATLTDDNYRDRTLKITYPGTSVDSQKRKAYVSAVLPRYIPYGVTIEWIREVPVASRFGLRTGSVTIGNGWRPSGDDGARIGFRTAGITAIAGDVVRTPTATRAGFRTEIAGVTKDPGASRIGMRTGSISKTTGVTLIAAGYDDNDITPTETYSTIFGLSKPGLIDLDQGTFVVQTGNDSNQDAGAVECSVASAVKYIHLYDSLGGIDKDGLWTGGTNDTLEVYYSTGGNWTLLETFVSPTRTNQKIELEIASPTSAKYWKVRASNVGCLRTLRGTRYGWAEIELMEIKEVT